MKRGYVKLWRRIDDNPIALKPAYLSVWLFIVRFANFKDKEIIWNNKKTIIRKGSFITSAHKISFGTGVPRGTVERILKYLKNEEMIEEVTNYKFRLIKVLKYKEYQSYEEVNDEQVRSKRGASEEQVDTTNNVKNEKNVDILRISSEQSSQVKQVMDIFHKINPTINWGNTTIRKATTYLIDKFGLEGTIKMAKVTVAIQGKPYAPVVTDPYQMKNKLAQIKIYFDRQKSKRREVFKDDANDNK